MIIYNTVLNDTTTFLTVSSSLFDDLVAGTYSALKVIITTSAGTSYEQTMLTADVAINVSGDDSVILEPSLIDATATTFPNDFYSISIYSGILFDVEEDAGCTLVGHTLACDIATKLLSDSTTTFHLTYDALDNAKDCLSCDCASLTLCYTTLVTDVASTDATSDCGCS